jgi:hypothetical protein
MPTSLNNRSAAATAHRQQKTRRKASWRPKRGRFLTTNAAGGGYAGIGRNRSPPAGEIVGNIMVREARRFPTIRSAPDSDDKRRAGGEAPRTTSSSG